MINTTNGEKGKGVSGEGGGAEDVQPSPLAATMPALSTRTGATGRLPVIGALVGAKYQLVSKIGAGGMGAVFLARDVVLDREVAVKFVLSDPRAPVNRAQFLREARAMARVHHDHVVAIYDFGEHDGSPYFVMEYVRGVALQEWLESHAELSIDEALGILGQICAGVQAIHDAGTVHRDLKPANILVAEGFKLVIVDLGLAEFGGTSLSTSERVAGTPEYMAPETAMNLKLDAALAPRTDIYALGVIAFQLLTGRTPFQGKTMAAILEKHATVEPEAPSQLRGDLPGTFDPPVLAALRKDPSKRPPAAAEWMATLMNARRSIPAPSLPRSVLIVDDDLDFAQLARQAVQSAIPDASIEVAGTGRDALEALERSTYSVVVLDLKLPDTNGIEVAASIAASIAASNCRSRSRVIVVTAHGGAADWRVLRGMGVDAFMVKPIDPTELGQAVRRLLGLESA